MVSSHARSLLRRVSIVLFGLLGLFLVAFGALYASVRDMLWFHAAAVPEVVRADVKPLYFALMKLIGGASVGLGLSSIYVTVGPLRRGDRYAAAALTVTVTTPLVIAAYVAEHLARVTGAPTSWHIMGLLLAMTAAALAAHCASCRGP